jgi:hypothetical protein
MRKAGIFRKAAKRSIDESIHAARSFAGQHEGALEAYDRLLLHVQSRTGLLRPCDRAKGKVKPFNAGLLALSLHHADWLRSIESWNPQSQPDWPLFNSLAHHLFARYPVPPFMASVWLELPAGEILPQHGWYRHLGLGQSIRTAGLPLRFTSAMAHLFNSARHHYTACAALRWAQVRGMGGTEELARAVISTRLGKVLENEDFWETALHFFIKQRNLDFAQVGPIVDFLQYQKFDWKEVVAFNGVVTRRPPPQPEYSVKGRTAASIQRHVDQWHRRLGKDANQPDVSWRRSPIKEFRLVEGSEALENMRVWTITELLSSRALLNEGKALCHCVATYAERCARRQTSIWSLQLENPNGRRRVLTVEADLQRKMICQIRGKYNRLPKPSEKEVVGRWAAQEGLHFAEWLRA